MVATHNTSFWNINIQLTSHDDLTEKSVLAKPANKIIMVKKKNLLKWQKIETALCDLTKKLLPSYFVSGQSGLRFATNLQINLEAKSMDGSS